VDTGGSQWGKTYYVDSQGNPILANNFVNVAYNNGHVSTAPSKTEERPGIFWSFRRSSRASFILSPDNRRADIESLGQTSDGRLTYVTTGEHRSPLSSPGGGPGGNVPSMLSSLDNVYDFNKAPLDFDNGMGGRVPVHEIFATEAGQRYNVLSGLEAPGYSHAGLDRAFRGHQQDRVFL